MGFNVLKQPLPREVLKPDGTFSKVKSQEEYIKLTQQALIESSTNLTGLELNIEILTLLERYQKFFASEYNEVTGNKEFLKIKEIFFRGLWMHKAIYVGYSQDLVDLELTLAKSNESLTNWDVLPNTKWRVYVIKKDKNNIKYTSLITGISDIKIPDEELIEVRWDQAYIWRFLSWWKIATNMNHYETMFFELSKVATKRVILDTNDEITRLNAEKAIKNTSTVLSSMGTGGNITSYEGVEFVKIPELKDYFDAMQQWFYFNAGQLGFTGNTSEKSERMTTGDHLKDLKTVINQQQNTLDHLKAFEEEALEKWGQQLKFEVTSSLSMDGSSIDINDAETPQGAEQKDDFKEKE